MGPTGRGEGHYERMYGQALDAWNAEINLRRKFEEALRGLLSNIKMHHDKSCPGLIPADCLDAIYEAAETARAVLPNGGGVNDE